MNCFFEGIFYLCKWNLESGWQFVWNHHSNNFNQLETLIEPSPFGYGPDIPFRIYTKYISDTNFLKEFRFKDAKWWHYRQLNASLDIYTLNEMYFKHFQHSFLRIFPPCIPGNFPCVWTHACTMFHIQCSVYRIPSNLIFCLQCTDIDWENWATPFFSFPNIRIQFVLMMKKKYFKKNLPQIATFGIDCVRINIQFTQFSDIVARTFGLWMFPWMMRFNQKTTRQSRNHFTFHLKQQSTTHFFVYLRKNGHFRDVKVNKMSSTWQRNKNSNQQP